MSFCCPAHTPGKAGVSEARLTFYFMARHTLLIREQSLGPSHHQGEMTQSCDVSGARDPWEHFRSCLPHTPTHSLLQGGT